MGKPFQAKSCAGTMNNLNLILLKTFATSTMIKENNVYQLISRNIHKTRSYRPFINEKLCLLATAEDSEVFSG
jgi:hypothetical protein